MLTNAPFLLWEIATLKLNNNNWIPSLIFSCCTTGSRKFNNCFSLEESARTGPMWVLAAGCRAAKWCPGLQVPLREESSLQGCFSWTEEWRDRARGRIGNTAAGNFGCDTCSSALRCCSICFGLGNPPSSPGRLPHLCGDRHSYLRFNCLVSIKHMCLTLSESGYLLLQTLLLQSSSFIMSCFDTHEIICL